MTDRIAEIRAYVAPPATGAIPFDDARTLLTALDAAQARVRELEALCFDHADAGYARGRAEGFRAGVEAMRMEVIDGSEELPWMAGENLKRWLIELPLPEPESEVG